MKGGRRHGREVGCNATKLNYIQFIIVACLQRSLTSWNELDGKLQFQLEPQDRYLNPCSLKSASLQPPLFTALQHFLGRFRAEALKHYKYIIALYGTLIVSRPFCKGVLVCCLNSTVQLFHHLIPRSVSPGYQGCVFSVYLETMVAQIQRISCLLIQAICTY